MNVSLEMEDRLTVEEKRGKDPSTSKDSVHENEVVQKIPNDSVEGEDPEEMERVKEYQSKPLPRRYFLESISALYTVGTVLYMIPINTVMRDKTCLYVYGYNESVCSNLNNQTEVIRNPVLANTNIYSTLRDIVMNAPGGIAAIVAGNYLMRYGFRTPLIVTLVGGTMTCVLQLLTVLVMPAPVVFNALAESPGSIAGGPLVISTAVYTNIALRVPKSLHMHRFTAMSVFGGSAALIGVFFGASLAAALGTEIFLALCATLLTIPTILVVFFLEDIDVPEENKKDSWRESLWLSLKNGFKTSVKAVSQKRPDRRRTLIVCILISHAACSVGIPATTGGFAIAFTGSVMGYGPNEFALYSGVSMILAFACLFPMIYLSKELKLSSPVMIAGGAMCFVARFALLATTEFFRPLFYIQMFVGIPYLAVPLSITAYMTGLVEKSEVSVVMALLALIDKFVPISTGLLGSYVYELTSISFPGCFYLILTFVYLIPVFLSLYCRMISRSNEREKQESSHL